MVVETVIVIEVYWAVRKRVARSATRRVLSCTNEVTVATTLGWIFVPPVICLLEHWIVLMSALPSLHPAHSTHSVATDPTHLSSVVQLLQRRLVLGLQSG